MYSFYYSFEIRISFVLTGDNKYNGFKLVNDEESIEFFNNDRNFDYFPLKFINILKSRLIQLGFH